MECRLDASFQELVAGMVFVGVASNFDEEADHRFPIIDINVLGGDALFCAVHVVVIAQGNADGGGGVTVDVVNGGFAGAARHEGALVVESLVALGEAAGEVGDEVGEVGVEDAASVADADDDAFALRGVGLHGAGFDC